MLERAYLVAYLEHAGDGVRFVGAAIFSEPHPTTIGSEGRERCTAVIAEMPGETYGEAKRALLEQSATLWPWLAVTQR